MFLGICFVVGLLIATGGFCLYYGGGWCLAAALAAALLGTVLASLIAKSGKRGETAGWCIGIFALSALVLFTIMAAKGVSSTVFKWLLGISIISGICSALLLSYVVDKEERKKQAKQKQKQEERKKQNAELFSCILLPDTCFLMDLGSGWGSSDFCRVVTFCSWFESQCMKCSRKVTLHRHVYQEIQKLYNGEDREKSKKAQDAKKLIERWQKQGIVQTYPDLEDKEKSYYADDALLKYMEELLQKGEKVRLLTNDLDLRIRARDRFEKLGKALPEDMLLSLDDILDKWPR